jgi:hypothetical protein
VLEPQSTRTYIANMLAVRTNASGIGRHLLANWPTSF